MFLPNYKCKFFTKAKVQTPKCTQRKKVKMSSKEEIFYNHFCTKVTLYYINVIIKIILEHENLNIIVI